VITGPISGGFTAAVLAGGAATRLRPVLSDRPKTLALIRGRPFLLFLLDQLVTSGADRIVLCTGHLGDHIREAIGDHYGRCPVIYSHETSPLGTAGALRAAMHCCDASLWLIANGDSYIAAALGEFLSWYRQSGPNGAMLLTWVPDASRFGTVELAETGLIRRFQARGRAVPGWINAGIYLLPRARIETLPEPVFLSLEHDIFPRWAEEGLAAYCVKAPFIDIGTPDSLREAAQFFAEAVEIR
jgi:NDP-sugar pyrophosphorylase family protein